MNQQDFKTPVLRKLMSREEVKQANQWVKLGLLSKGHSDDKKGSVMYYFDPVLNKNINDLDPATCGWDCSK